MKVLKVILGLVSVMGLVSLAQAETLAGSVTKATGFLAQSGWTDCQVTVDQMSREGMTATLLLINQRTGQRAQLKDVNLNKKSRVDLEKLMYDLASRTEPQLIEGTGIVPAPMVQYGSLIKVKSNSIEYTLNEYRSNGNFYGATSTLKCIVK